MALIRYPGGKGKLSRQIRRYFPEEVTLGGPGSLFSHTNPVEYREPFFGAGAIGFDVLRSLPSGATVRLRDKDGDLVALWQSVWKSPAELCQMIEGFTPSTDAFYRFKEEDGKGGTDPVRRGFRKLALHQMSMSGFGCMAGGPLGGREQRSEYNVDCRWSPIRLVTHVNDLHDVFARFGRNLQISTGDFAQALTAVPRNCFLYLDPPYVAAGPALYKHAMSENDHRRLAALLQVVSCPWVLSYDDHPLVRELYGGWTTIKTVSVTYTGAIVEREGERPKNKEIVIFPPERKNWRIEKAAASPDVGQSAPVGRPKLFPGNNLGQRDRIDRASTNGVSRITQWRLDILARERPDLLQRVIAGGLGVRPAVEIARGERT